MCVAVPVVAMVAMTAASAAVSYAGAQQQANAQRAYGEQVYEQQSQQAIADAEYQNRQVTRNNEFILQNAENVRAALSTDQDALVAQERQEAIATAINTQQQRIDRIRAVGAIQASERAGLTLETLLNDFDRQESQNNFITQQNLAFSSGQRQRESQNLVATARGRINEARPYEAAPFQSPQAPAPVSNPSLLGTVIGAGSSIAGTLNSRSTYDPTRGRYVIGTQTRLPTTLPTYSAPSRNFSSGFAKTSRLGSTQGLK